MKIFQVRVFEKDGVLDTSKFVLKVGRGGFHPGVAAMLLAEAFGLSMISGTALKDLFEYAKGARYHRWTLTGSELEQVSRYLAKFSDDEFQIHYLKLKSTLPETPKNVVETDGNDDDGADDSDTPEAFS